MKNKGRVELFSENNKRVYPSIWDLRVWILKSGFIASILFSHKIFNYYFFNLTEPQLHYLKSTKILTKLSYWMLRRRESTKFYLTCSEKWMPWCSNGWFGLFSKTSKLVLAKRKFLIFFMTTQMIFMTRMPTLERWVTELLTVCWKKIIILF